MRNLQKADKLNEIVEDENLDIEIVEPGGIANSEHPPLRIRSSEWGNEFCELKTHADPTGLKLLNEVKDKFL